MTGLLASVVTLEEAKLAARFKVSIIDLKQPANGALGALPVAEVRPIVNALQPEHCLSATIGDLPMQPEPVRQAVQAMAATGVDYVKIGFFTDGDWQPVLDALASVEARLIAVLFADQPLDLQWLQAFKQAGFSGVMLDTQNKRQSLTDWQSLDQLEAFVNQAKRLNLLAGLAGSLRAEHVPRLLPLAADYLGFRGGLCRAGRRTSGIDEQALTQVSQCFAAAGNAA
ncbi:MAG: (5-formylfuran-3-yl)methyl phosphate synthase [Methylococcales bacterium]|nr:(5-formylfuran-3-yl)methyl phosphate synthase [Methylococcales bacterium]